MPMHRGVFDVQVQSIGSETKAIRSYVLAHPERHSLPEFSAGAHIDVHLENGLIRQYSLCSCDADPSHYRIGVLRESPGTGGSEYLFDQVQVGDRLKISAPKNLFKLVPEAKHHLLIAGGIGITPLLSMVRKLERDKAKYTMHYCTRSPQDTAFREELQGLVHHGRLEFHFDGGNPEYGLDLQAALDNVPEGTHLYYCGPPGLMDAARKASCHWPTGTVHYEYFSTDSLDSLDVNARNDRASAKEFQIRVASSGESLTVLPHQTIVDVLRDNGYVVDTSCEEGICGTCLTRYLDGEPEHHDQILDESDRETYLTICCARSKTPELVLDL